MKRALKQAMKSSISNVLETMFFMPVTFEEEGIALPPEPADWAACSIAFTGRVSGSLLVVIPAPLLSALTENFSGQAAEQIDEAFREQTLAEIANMVAGNALSSLDELSDFHLGIPGLLEREEAAALLSRGEGSGFRLHAGTEEGDAMTFKVVMEPSGDPCHDTVKG